MSWLDAPEEASGLVPEAVLDPSLMDYQGGWPGEGEFNLAGEDWLKSDGDSFSAAGAVQADFGLPDELFDGDGRNDKVAGPMTDDTAFSPSIFLPDNDNTEPAGPVDFAALPPLALPAATAFDYSLTLRTSDGHPFPVPDLLSVAPVALLVNGPPKQNPAPGAAWNRKLKHSRKSKETGENIYPAPVKPADTVYWTAGGEEVHLQYTLHGEFDPSVTFNSDTFLGYLEQGRRGGFGDGRAPRLWIQNQPAQYNVRYPRGRDSFKCRFHDCPVAQRTIRMGMWRVAVDEFPAQTGRARDPFWNAGYAHLYCLEQHADLYDLVRRGLAWADTRCFDFEDRNPMALGAPLWDAFQEWCADQEAKHQRHCAAWRAAGLPPPRRQLAPDDFLYYRLTRRRLELDSPAREQARARRGRAAAQRGSESVSIDTFMGDLAVYASRVARRRARCQGLRGPPPGADVVVVDDDGIPPIGAPARVSPGPGAPEGARASPPPPPPPPPPPGEPPRTGRKRSRDEDDGDGEAVQVVVTTCANCSSRAVKRLRLDAGQQAPFPGSTGPAGWVPEPSAYPDPGEALEARSHPYGQDVSAAPAAPPPLPPLALPQPRAAEAGRRAQGSKRRRGEEDEEAQGEGREWKRRGTW